MTWNDTFLALFERCCTLYRGGDDDFENYYSADDLTFLTSIGYQKREFFDFVEDYCEGGVPTPTTALLIAAVRRDYFLAVQGGKPSGNPKVLRDAVPAKDSELDGMTYLPRIIAKAEAKLRGDLDPDLMFSCGGDRKFLNHHGDLHPADFLRHVWAADGNPSKLVDWIKSQ